MEYSTLGHTNSLTISVFKFGLKLKRIDVIATCLNKLALFSASSRITKNLMNCLSTFCILLVIEFCFN